MSTLLNGALRIWRSTPGERKFRVLGCDLGQSNDPSAAVVLERIEYDDAFIGPRDLRIKVKAIRRWPLNTDYCQVVTDLLSAEANIIVVEYNGVGRPVVDLLRKSAKNKAIIPVITAASNTTTSRKSDSRGLHWIVPKIELITSIVLLQQAGLLRLPNVPEVSMLLGELRNFQMRITRSAHIQFGNAPGRGKHDDLVIALGLGAWWMNLKQQRLPAIFC